MEPASETNPIPPGVPSAAMLLLAFGGVVAAGLLGGLAAFGIVDTGCRGDCVGAAAVAAIAGAGVAAIGAGVVAVLVLRARSFWRRPTAAKDP